MLLLLLWVFYFFYHSTCQGHKITSSHGKVLMQKKLEEKRQLPNNPNIKYTSQEIK